MFRRKKSADPAAQDDAATPETSETPSAPATTDELRAEGPWDASEVTLDDEQPGRVDLGSLLLTGRPGLELRLQVDEASQQVAAVLLMGPDGAVELRPFAAPRNGDIWDEIRPKIAAETARRGGTATEADGAYGKELRVVMPVTTPDGEHATQPSRVMGIAGPRWLLRATFLGRPALEPRHDGEIESALRDVVVVRGDAPMAPGDPLPLKMPGNAQLISQG
ncbi:MAG TPA: DUF3710 domain-containing protein [Nocardioidaceae bacterium]|nr:DUF3710 domain-containing protein [Nocardioidaceae bacterium]